MNLFEDLLSHYVLQEAISLKNAKKKLLSKKYSAPGLDLSIPKNEETGGSSVPPVSV